MPVSQEIPLSDMSSAITYWTLSVVFVMQLVMMIVLFRLSKRVKRVTWLIENGGAEESSRSSSRSTSRRSGRSESRSSLSIGENASRRASRSGNASKEEDYSRYDGSSREVVPADHAENEDRSGAEQGRQFAEFLNEDPSRMELSKKEQFEAFRRWRSQKGLNWRGS